MKKKPTYATRSRARIEYLKVQNFRALREVEFKELTPLTVLLGPNGSGKSTVFDVFAFLAECFELGLRRAWDKRGRAKELKTRGGDGPVTIEIKYREPGYPLITYHLAVDERAGGPVVVEEWLRWKRGSHGQPFRFLDYREGKGKTVSGGTSARGSTARLHHRLVCVLSFGRPGARSTRGRSAGAHEQDRRQPGQRHPVPCRTAR
jgi:predicted ATPase